jgi:hypothetical protein
MFQISNQFKVLGVRFPGKKLTVAQIKGLYMLDDRTPVMFYT